MTDLPPPLNTYTALVSAFTSLLTVAIHTILYERNIYPPTTFLSVRKYNYPVRQNRHPKVCTWINDAVAAVEEELLKGAVSRVAVVIYSAAAIPLERFLFDVSGFPTVPISEVLTQFEAPNPHSAAAGTSTTAINPVDLEEQFRAIMRRLAFCGSSLGRLPDGCSFTVSIELRDKVEPPIGHPQPWIPVPPPPSSPRQPASSADPSGPDRADIRTHPLRTLSAYPFVLELYIEEAAQKKASSLASSVTAAASTSAGAPDPP